MAISITHRPEFAPAALRDICALLLTAYGPQGWWPAETPFEVMIGAILTQNTAWANVERAIENLKARGALAAETILGLTPAVLAELIRPAGYFNVKAQRLREFCLFYQASGGWDGLAGLPTSTLRQRLLSIKGIGPETADDILLYAFARPVFVIDAYTRRIFTRLALIRGDEPYETLRLAFESALGPDVGLYQEYHALLVEHAKQVCGARPRCSGCVLNGQCTLPVSVLT
ncbi:endonuclease III domain-containing protein [Caldichromatium japonicum]|uniref:Endonuclease III domain-containing protein n=1 Tax=Caldichromatium japonicum TaxID=2699430 RepID=A0A6G7VGL2_9GAMM|nr:endonuclease III domain-containing protein [Caldichromatium japonicum]QIK39005.1 endonuclease III domain-containing protein [Caldichromatium japonicum]